MSEFVEVLKLGDLAEGSAARVEIGDAEICIVRTKGADSAVYAIDDICSHAEVSLSEGEVDGCFIDCWLHGSRFDLRTGVPSGPPATIPVPTYSVRVDGTGDDAAISIELSNGIAVTEGAHSTWQN